MRYNIDVENKKEEIKWKLFIRILSKKTHLETKWNKISSLDAYMRKRCASVWAIEVWIFCWNSQKYQKIVEISI